MLQNLNPIIVVGMAAIIVLLFAMLSYILIAWSRFRLHALDLMPVAYAGLFESMGEGVLVLDPQDRIISINSVARRWLRVGEEAIGRNVAEVVGGRNELLGFNNVVETHTQLELGEGPARQVLLLTISPLVDKRQRTRGRIFGLHDITREHVLLETERQRARQMELLNAITRAALTTADFREMLQTLTDRLGELFRADGSYLTLWDEEQNRSVPAVSPGTPGDIFLNPRAVLNGKTVAEIVSEAGPLVFDNVAGAPYLSPDFSELCAIRSFVALPLVANAQKLGAAFITFNQVHDFSREDITLGEQVASQIALAVVKAKLYATESRRAAQLSALQSVSEVVTSSLELRWVFKTVVQVLQEAFGYSYVSIYHLDGQVLHLGAQVGYPEELVYRDVPVDRGILGRTVRTRQPQFVRDVTQDPDFLRASYEIGSEICVPLLKDEEVLGTLNVESPYQHPLTETDKNLLITFASQVVVAIINAGLYQSEHEERELAEALREVAVTLSESLDFETVLDRLLVLLGRVVPYDSACILLVDKDHQVARVMRMSGYEQYGYEAIRQMAALNFEIATSPLFRTMVETGNPLIVPNTATDPGWIRVIEHIRSWAGAPIIINGQVAAFFSLDKTAPDYYRPAHVEQLTTFANQAAVAFRNASLYAEVQRLAIVDELTGLYNRRGLFEIGRRELEGSIRFRRPLSVLFMDVDNFKLFNDTYSYAVGDLVLRLLAGCLKSNSREVDLVGRYGGDEFVVLLTETEINAATRVAERIRLSVEAIEVETDRGKTGFTVSIGVNQRTPDITDLESLLDVAGLYLHEAKKKGRNQIIVAPLQGETQL